MTLAVESKVNPETKMDIRNLTGSNKTTRFTDIHLANHGSPTFTPICSLRQNRDWIIDFLRQSENTKSLL